MNYNIIIDFKKADVNDDGIDDSIYLVGTKKQDELIINDIRLVIRDGSNNNSYQINLNVNKGYNPKLFIGHFTSEKENEMLISIESGNTGREGYYYIYSFKNNNEKKLFDFEEFNNKYKYTVEYQNNYLVIIKSIDNNLKYNIDINYKGADYLDRIYNNDGTLKKPLKGQISPLIELSPVVNSVASIYDLDAVQRVIGYYNADTLGMLVSPLRWNGNEYILKENPYLTVNGTIIGSNSKK